MGTSLNTEIKLIDCPGRSEKLNLSFDHVSLIDGYFESAVVPESNKRKVGNKTIGVRDENMIIVILVEVQHTDTL